MLSQPIMSVAMGIDRAFSGLECGASLALSNQYVPDMMAQTYFATFKARRQLWLARRSSLGVYFSKVWVG